MSGQEYAVDTVSKDGEIKVTGINAVYSLSLSLVPRLFFQIFFLKSFLFSLLLFLFNFTVFQTDYFLPIFYPHVTLYFFQVLALWKYRKLPVNGAPFVYECTELVASGSEEENSVRTSVSTCR